MSAYLDVVFSIFLASLLLIMIIGYNNDLVEKNYINNMYLNVQQVGIDLKELLNYDLKSISLGITDTTIVFVIADSNTIKFKTDLGLDGSINEIYYYIGDVASAGSTENPNDKILYRQIDGNPVESYSIGLIDLQFSYFNISGNQTSVLADIVQIEYSFSIENTFSYNGEYPGMYLQGRIRPKNIVID
ncbi:MAG: hypothetical protein GY863_14605 [bacterium]|nr:hypothetical protein [bacterium]